MPSTLIKHRTRISLDEKVKLIEDSKKHGFNRKMCDLCQTAHLRVESTKNSTLILLNENTWRRNNFLTSDFNFE